MSLYDHKPSFALSAAPKPRYSVYLLISTQDAKGNVKQWAVEGDTVDALRRRRHKDDDLRMGEVITVSGRPARAGKNSRRECRSPYAGRSRGRSIWQRKVA